MKKMLVLNKEMLLRSYNRSRTTQSYPAYEKSSWKFIVFDCITCNKTPGSSQTSFTMNCNSSLWTLDNVQERVNDLKRWRCTIWKIKVMMLNSIFNKCWLFVSCWIEPNNCLYIESFKNRNVVFWMEGLVLTLRWIYCQSTLSRIWRRTERN